MGAQRPGLVDLGHRGASTGFPIADTSVSSPSETGLPQHNVLYVAQCYQPGVSGVVRENMARCEASFTVSFTSAIRSAWFSFKTISAVFARANWPASCAC